MVPWAETVHTPAGPYMGSGLPNSVDRRALARASASDGPPALVAFCLLGSFQSLTVTVYESSRHRPARISIGRDFSKVNETTPMSPPNSTVQGAWGLVTFPIGSVGRPAGQLVAAGRDLQLVRFAVQRVHLAKRDAGRAGRRPAARDWRPGLLVLDPQHVAGGRINPPLAAADIFRDRKSRRRSGRCCWHPARSPSASSPPAPARPGGRRPKSARQPPSSCGGRSDRPRPGRKTSSRASFPQVDAKVHAGKHGLRIFPRRCPAARPASRRRWACASARSPLPCRSK